MTRPPQSPSVEQMMSRAAGKMLGSIDAARRAAAEMTAVDTESSSDDGMVRVRATPDNPVEDLVIHPRAMRLPATELAELLQRQIRAANGLRGSRAQDAAREAFGDDLPDHEAVIEQSGQVFESMRKQAADADAQLQDLRNKLQLP